MASISVCLQVQDASAIDDYNFVAAGDWGCTSNTDSTINNMISKSPERVLGLGDYSYASTGTCWFNKMSPLQSITKITIGNHEDDSSEGFSGYMTQFYLSQTYYSFNYQNTHFLVMDTDRNVYSSGSPQHTFVINDLQSASQNQSIDWIVVYLHKFMYTSPSEESAFTSLRNTYHPIFDQYGVDLVLQGHQHTYQRTFPIKYNTNNPSDPTKTSTIMNDYSDTEGQIFAIVGTGGQNFDSLSGKASYVVSQQASKFGMIDVTITNDGSRLEGKYYTNDGALFDQFSITKANLPPVANNQAVSVTKDTPKSITLTAIDENNDPLIYSIVGPPLHAILSGDTGATRTYTPTTGYVGTDTFTFKATDGTIDSNIANVSVNVQNGPPIATNQQVNVNKNTQKTITLTATDPNNDPLSYVTAATTQQAGTLSPSGNTSSAIRTYIPPNPNFVGTDSFTFTANDGTDNSNTATVSITVQDTTSCTTNLPISAVTASGNDGNVPSNVLDNNLNTRWSNLGAGQFITANLGSTQNVCSVDIAWYKGNERAYNFVIATSTDGTTFTTKLTSTSSGITLSPEKYTFAATDARYIRITVNGNTANTWTSITEIDVFGSGSASSSSLYNFDPSLTLSGPSG